MILDAASKSHDVRWNHRSTVVYCKVNAVGKSVKSIIIYLTLNISRYYNHAILLQYVMMGKDAYMCAPVYWYTLWDVLVEIKCNDGPCNNGGSCRDHPNGFTCKCPYNYEGNTCANGMSINKFICDAIKSS